jgi:ubiquinone/menaquinone biosynthesis C-methylase UbiE
MKMQAVSICKSLVRGLQRPSTAPHLMSRLHSAGAPRFLSLSVENTFSERYSSQNNNKRYLTTRSKPTLKSSSAAAVEPPSAASSSAEDVVEVPQYLKDTYTWAYLHPNAVWFFERQWLVNAILWGNYPMLRDAVISDLCGGGAENKLSGDTLQIACAYGDLTQHLASRLDTSTNSSLSVVDVAPIQLENLHKKLVETNQDHLVTLTQQNANHLSAYDDNSMDQVLFFFLLHEIPLDVRIKAVEEAFRVCKPGGKVFFVDYHQPTAAYNPWRYLMRGVLTTLEPFALDLWRYEIAEWIPTNVETKFVEKKTYFGGLYQKVIVEKL